MKSIQTKLTVVVLSILVVSMCILGGLNYWRAKGIITENITEGMRVSADSNAKDIGSWLEMRKSELSMLAALPTIQNGVPEEIAPVLKSVAKANDTYLLISYVTPQGVAYTSNGDKLQVAERDYFKEAIAGRTFISDPMVGKSTGRPLTVVAIPVKKDGKVSGMVYGAIDMGTIEKKAEDIKLGETGYAFMVQEDGLRIVHPDKDKAMKYNPVKDGTLSPEEKNINEHMLKGETGVAQYSSDGTQHFIAYAPVPDTKWSMAIVVPTAEVTGVISSLTFISLITIVIVLILSGLAIVWFARRMASPIRELETAANRIAAGNLSQTQIFVDSDDEIGRLGRSFGQMAKSLRTLVQKVQGATEQVSASSEELTASSGQASQAAQQVAESITSVADGAAKQLKAVDETTNIVEQLSAGIQAVATNASNVAATAQETSTAAQEGGRAVDQVTRQMAQIEKTVDDSAQLVTKLGERSKKISSIVDTISGIAGQTTLLALNAAIEAARAGEQGRGFAVVATEVSKLAEESQEAAKQIADTIREIQTDTDTAVNAMSEGTREVKTGTEVVNATGSTFEKIIKLIGQLSDQVNSISAAIEQMAASSQNIVTSVEDIDRISKQSSANTQMVSAATEEQLASMEEIASSSQALAGLAQDLQAEVVKFKV